MLISNSLSRKDMKKGDTKYRLLETKPNLKPNQYIIQRSNIVTCNDYCKQKRNYL